ncbi:MAG: fibronectin type III-like domain-contianing protein [Saccharofermentanales bacterium]
MTASVQNTGTVPGAEVVQVYIGSAGAADHRPVRMLRGFSRIELEPGSGSSVCIDIAAEDLKFYDPLKKAWSLDAAYNVYAGNSSAASELICTIQLRNAFI